jgi:uncharacterized membrane protein YdjX (TVP38/TMEM64 family)
MSRSLWLRLVLLLILAAAVVAVLLFLPVREHLGQLLTWIQRLGWWGPVLMVGIYVVACVLWVPGSLLTLGIGYAFGLAAGLVIVSLGSTLGASAAFLLGRTLARGWVESRIAGSPRFRALDHAVAEHGFKIVLLTRLSPVFPFALLNYAFGATRVSFRDYVLASWIGMLPGTVVYVYLGSIAQDLADLASGRTQQGPAHYVLLAMGLVATLFVTVYLTHLARRALAKAMPGAGPGNKSV